MLKNVKFFAFLAKRFIFVAMLNGKKYEVMKKEITNREKQNILKLQATLTKIDNNQPCFFNIIQYKNMGLIREFGKTSDNKTNYVLTDKAKQIMNVQL